MRIRDHPILDFPRREEFTFTFEGSEIRAEEGDTIASALVDTGVKEFSPSRKKGRPRGLFCSIGKCSSCLMTVDGVPNVRVCITEAREGMEVRKQTGDPSLAPLPQRTQRPKPDGIEDTDIAVVGGGPAGLKASLTAADEGVSVTLIDENSDLGGQLVKQTHKFFGSTKEKAGMRGVDIGGELSEAVFRRANIDVRLHTSAVGIYDNNRIGLYERNEDFRLLNAQRIILATGALERTIVFENNDLPGIFGAGGVQTLMNKHGVLPGEKALVVGAGNVGLIVAYQLLQAGTDVVAVVEAMPRIGGYFVHAAKIRGQGIPILTNHTVVKALGRSFLEGVVTAPIDDSGFIDRSGRKEWSIDLLALAVGLQPGYKLAHQAGCRVDYAPSLGGYVPIRDSNLKSSIDSIYVAGDVSGVEEATTAMLEGEIAGLAASDSLGFCDSEKVSAKLDSLKRNLNVLRSGPFYSEIGEDLDKVVIG